MHVHTLVGMFTPNPEGMPETATIGNSASLFVSRARLLSMRCISMAIRRGWATQNGHLCGSKGEGDQDWFRWGAQARNRLDV
jgi:hypothetical protein